MFARNDQNKGLAPRRERSPNIVSGSNKPPYIKHQDMTTKKLTHNAPGTSINASKVQQLTQVTSQALQRRPETN